MLDILKILEDQYLNFDDVIAIANMNSEISPVDVFWNKIVVGKPLKLTPVCSLTVRNLAKAIDGRVATGNMFFHPKLNYIVADCDILVKNEIPVIVCESLDEINTARLCWIMKVLGKKSGGIISPKDGKYQYTKLENNESKPAIGSLLLREAVRFWEYNLKELKIPSPRNASDNRKLESLKDHFADLESRPSGTISFLAFREYHNNI